MAKFPVLVEPGDIICLVNPGEVIIGRFLSLSDDKDSVGISKPHILMLRPTPQGMSAGFMVYGDQAFLEKKDIRFFELRNFITIDKADETISEAYNGMLSNIKTPPKTKLIGI